MSGRKSPAAGRALLGRAAFFTVAFGLVAHGARFLRLDFAHDATLVFQCDDVWQARLGRYLMPAYTRLRGQLVAPWWVGLLALAFLALAVWLVCDLLALSSPGAVALTAGLMVLSPAFTFANAAYLPWSDVYMLSLLCAVAAVWVWRRKRRGWLPAMALVCASVALYPSYFQATVFLMLVLLAGDCLDEAGPSAKALVRRGLGALGTLAGGLAVYGLSYLAVLAAFGLRTGTAANSVVHVADLTVGALPGLLGGTYASAFGALAARYALHPALVTALAVALLAATAAALVALFCAGRRTPSRGVLLAVLVALMPLGIHCIYLLTQGQVHVLMTYPLCLAPVACLALWQRLWRKGKGAWVRVSRAAVCAALAVILFSCAGFANQLYLSQALKADNTRAVFTRLLDRVEQSPGYVPGQTPVALVGELQGGPLAVERPGFEHLSGAGVDGDFSVTHRTSYEYYFQYVLGYPIKLASDKEVQDCAQLPQVQALEPFPALNCAVSLPDGTLAVRLS